MIILKFKTTTKRKAVTPPNTSCFTCSLDAAFVVGLVHVILLNVLPEMCAVSTGNTKKQNNM